MTLQPSRPAGDDRSGFRRLRVVEKRPESLTATSLTLEPVEPQDWRGFAPGQFLVLRIPAAAPQGFVLRNYSISSSPMRSGAYRITVKRETDATGAPGLGSGYLHDRVDVGDELWAEGPRGSFTPDMGSRRPVVLLSGGVGLTPLVSMLHALATGTERTVHFIHACEDGEHHALADEVEALARLRDGVRVHFCYRAPSPTDIARGRHHSAGLVTRDLLQRLLPLDDYDFHLCGPAPFMQSVFAILRGLGVARERIAHEFFGPAGLLQDEAPAPPRAEAPEARALSGDGAAGEVEFRRSGRRATWSPEAFSLLELAEAAGLTPDFSCRAAICGSCAATLVSGEVDYFEPPLDDPGEGRVLLCCTRPRGNVVVDI